MSHNDDDLFPVPHTPRVKAIYDSGGTLDPKRDIPLFIAIAFVAWLGLTATMSWVTWYNFGITSLAFTFVLVTLFPLALLRLLRGSVRDAIDKSLADIVKPIKPSRRLERKIRATGEEEIPLYEMRIHPITLFWWFSVAGVLTIIGLVAASRLEFLAGSLVIIIAISAFMVRLGIWSRDRLCFSNKRVIGLFGFGNTERQYMPISKMTDMKMTVPWHSHVLAYFRIIDVPYGTIEAESAGQEQALRRVKYVQRADAVENLVMKVLLK